jgi:hypothetical protein
MEVNNLIRMIRTLFFWMCEKRKSGYKAHKSTTVQTDAFGYS